MADIRTMQLGQVVDFVIDYNDRITRSEKESQKKQKQNRKASQKEINAFFG